MINKLKKNKWTSTLLALILTSSIGLTGCNLSKNNDSNSTPTSLSNPTNNKENEFTHDNTTPTNSKTPGSTELYKSTELGLSIAFPISWSNKYTVKETDEGLSVYFKPEEDLANGQGLYFCILKKTKVLNESMYDSINGKRELTVNGISYFLGGPTDIALPESSAEFNTFLKLKSEIPDIINSIKAIQNQTNSQSNTNDTKSEQSTTPSTNQTKEIFYGQWVIKQVLAYGPVGTYSSEDANSILGKILSFSENKASCFGDQPSDIDQLATNPVYKKTIISKSDFAANYRITFDKLGIKADSISELTVSDSKGNGCTFFIKDDNTLIIYGGGTYFELIRKTS